MSDHQKPELTKEEIEELRSLPAKIEAAERARRERETKLEADRAEREAKAERKRNVFAVVRGVFDMLRAIVLHALFK